MSKPKKPIQETDESLELLNQAREGAFTGPDLMRSTVHNEVAPVSVKETWEKSQEVKKDKGVADYIGSMYREDGFIDRGLGALVGHTHFDPDDSWRPTRTDNWKDLTKDVPEEFHDEFYDTLSLGHALYTKDRILGKVKDRELLGTMETAGNVGRFAFGMVNPESLAIGAATMGVGKVAATAGMVKNVSAAKKMAAVASKIDDPARRAAQLAKATAAMEEAARKGSGIRGMAVGTAFGAGLEAGYETLRQSVGFEDDTGAIMNATLAGAAFAAPFAFVGARQMNRLAHAAAQEREVLGIFKRLHEGEDLNETDLKTLRDYGYKVDEVRRAEAGDFEDVPGRPDDIEQPPEPPVEEPEPPKQSDDIPVTEDAPDDIPEPPKVDEPELPIEPPKVETPEPPKATEGFTKFWENQDKPLNVDDFVQFEDAEGNVYSGDIKKVNPETGKLVIKTDDGVKVIKMGEVKLVTHQPPGEKGGEEVDAPDEPELPIDPPKVETPPEPPKVAEPPKVRVIKRDQIGPGKDMAKDKGHYTGDYSFMNTIRIGLKAGTAVKVSQKETLRSIKHHFAGSTLEPIIDRLLKSNELTTKVYLSMDYGSLRKGWGGVHVGGNYNLMAVFVKDKADLKKLNYEDAKTFIHELVHAHTVAALDGTINLTPTQKKAVKDLEDLYKVTKAWMIKNKGMKPEPGRRNPDGSPTYLANNTYGFTNVKEFVAEVFSNREFQKHLEQIKVGKTTAGGRFWSAVKKVLGIGKEMEDSAFKRAMVLTEELIGSRIQEVPASTPRIPGVEVGSIDLNINTLPTPTNGAGQPGTYMGFATIAGKRVPIRLDISSVLNRNPNPFVQQLGHELVKDPIGNSDKVAQGITVSERKERMNRVLAGKAHFEMKEAFRDAVKARGLNLIEQVKLVDEFYKNVTKVARGEDHILQSNPDIAAAYQRGAKALREFYDAMGDRAMKSGLEGAENLKLGESYVNRVYLHDKIQDLMNTHGQDNVYALFAESFRGVAHGDQKLAKKFVTAILDLKFHASPADVMLGARDMATLRRELDKAGLTKDQIDNIVDSMFEFKEGADGDKPGNLKFRMDLDETAEITIGGQVVRISDVLENDARLLVDKYMNTMGGHIALAEHGITSRDKWDARVNEANQWMTNNPTANADAHTTGMQLVQDMYDHIVGRPMSNQTFSKTDRFLGAMRSYTRSVFLGQLGLAAAGEIKNAMAMSAFHGAWSQMPSFGKLIQMIRNGIPVDDQLAKDIQHMAGFGNEFAMNYARQHEVADHTYNRGLTRFENFANKASHVVDIISGNATFTSATRNLAGKLTVQHLFDIARGQKKLDEAFSKRLVGQGIDEANIKATLDDLKTYSIADQRGVVQHVDWENWQQANRKTYDDFTLAMERFTRDGIQDQNIGETIHWMHSQLGKIVGELRTFSAVGHAKQFLKNVHYRDRTSAMVFATSFVGECLAYAVQTSINYGHNSEELNKRLTAERISKAAIQRMSALGILSFVVDTPHQWVTGKSFFGEGTANTDNRNLLMTPSLMLMSRLMGATQTAVQALSPVADTLTTKQEMRDALGILPGVNTWGARNIVDYVSSQYPKTDPSQYNR